MSNEKLSDMLEEWSLDEIYSPNALRDLAHNNRVHEAMKSANEVSRSLCREHGVSSISELPTEVQHKVVEEAGIVNRIVSLGLDHV